jgi:hypothetical protein
MDTQQLEQGHVIDTTSTRLNAYKVITQVNMVRNKGNNKITELRTILQRESQNS